MHKDSSFGSSRILTNKGCVTSLTFLPVEVMNLFRCGIKQEVKLKLTSKLFENFQTPNAQ